MGGVLPQGHGLIDDYKNLHGNGPPGTTATSRWQPPAYNSSRAFGTRYPRPGRRAFPLNHGAEWRKKYSLVNRPPGSLDRPGEGAAQPSCRAGGSQEPGPQQYVLERQVQLSPDQNMVIKIKPTSKPGSASASEVPRGSLEGDQDAPQGDPRPQEGEGEPPGGQRQPSRPARARGCCSAEDPLLVCRKEAGKTRAAKLLGSVGDSSPEPRRTVSESAIVVKGRCSPSAPAPRRKGAPQAGASCAAQLLGDGRASAGHPRQPAASGLGAALARPASGPRQTREASHPGPCRASKFQKSNYKWVAASAKSPRAPRRALSPRAAVGNGCRAPLGTAEAAEKPELGAGLDAKGQRPAAPSTPGASPSKYKWKASSPSASAASSHWPSEGSSKDRASRLSPVPSRSPPGGRAAGAPSSSKPLLGEPSLSAYKVKSRTKIIRKRTGAREYKSHDAITIEGRMLGTEGGVSSQAWPLAAPPTAPASSASAVQPGQADFGVGAPWLPPPLQGRLPPARPARRGCGRAGRAGLSPQMPVCSYFLRGVCSSSDCPYSHVYVSRKAEVCADFLKGYCPLGAKVRARVGMPVPPARSLGLAQVQEEAEAWQGPADRCGAPGARDTPEGRPLISVAATTVTWVTRGLQSARSTAWWPDPMVSSSAGPGQDGKRPGLVAGREGQ
ncbi:PREDICTED: zinc finger CCCH domain-containing protein 3 [Condylura cristata]|uniref:zinc finger CCCH domain-containing protein 3 n=1 Tax=Condylura cristata TaxID=143302 RepID=UPI000643A432|nr:PREDICTED: zinc finger CCCH domain-containing protein 3 [Condylura cristata]